MRWGGWLLVMLVGVAVGLTGRVVVTLGLLVRIPRQIFKGMMQFRPDTEI